MPKAKATAVTASSSPTASDVGAALHAALWAMRTHNAKAVLGTGITGPQAGVLWFLHEYKSLSLTRLAELQGNTPANMTGIVRRLERDGLILRRRHPTDNRVQMVELTAKGSEITRKARKALDLSMAHLFEGSSPEDLAVTLRVLEQVRRRADPDNPPS